MRYFLHYSLEADRSKGYEVERFTYTLHFASESCDLSTIGMVEIKRDQLLMLLHYLGLKAKSLKGISSLGRNYWLLSYGNIDSYSWKFLPIKGDIYLLRMLDAFGVHRPSLSLWK